MAGEWIAVPVQDIAKRTATGPFGSAISSKHFMDSGVPVIRGSNLSQIVSTRLDDSGLVFVSEEKAQEFGRSEARRGDLIFTCWGTIDQVGLIDSRAKYDRYIVSNKQMLLTPEKSIADSLYLYYYFASHETRAQIINEGIGSSVPGFNLGQLRSFKVPLPPLAKQKAIAAVLGGLDDKIELNRRMNAKLEEMARALFQSWFVDFNPVRAKVDGHMPVGLDPGTASLFPIAFQDSEAGHIPQGWTVEQVGEVTDCVGGGTPSTTEPKFWEGGTHHWATPKDLSSLETPILLDTARKLTEAGIAKISSGLLPAGTLLLSSRAPVGYLAIASMPVAINQGFIALKCNERASNFFLLNWCKVNMAEIESRATGTTFAEISKQSFRPICVVLPPSEVMSAFTEEVAPLYSQITANLQQSRSLASLRDTLLPKLISGQMKMPEVEKSLARNSL